jgi:large subunit ribosomal protein L23
MKDPRDIIIKPVVSEKSYALVDNGVYTFVVSNDANKIEIRQAIESIFNVKVTSVNTLNRAGKKTRSRRTGISSTRPDSKRAIITLAGDDRIALFDN